MNGLARILLEVCTGNADAFFVALVVTDKQFTMLDNGQVVLADLVSLGQIRVEVILSRKYRAWRHCSVHSEPEFSGHANHFLVQDRQNARVAQVDQAGLGIGLRTISC